MRWFLIGQIFAFGECPTVGKRFQPTLLVGTFDFQGIQFVAHFDDYLVQLLNVMLMVREQFFKLNDALT